MRKANRDGHAADLGVCLVTSPSGQGRGGYALTRNLVRVLEAVLPGARVSLLAGACRLGPWMPLRVLSVAIVQLKNSVRLLRLDEGVGAVFFTSGPTFILPMMAAKLKRKKVAYFISGLTGGDAVRRVNRLIYKDTLLGAGGFIFPRILAGLERLNYGLADVLVAESGGLAGQILESTRHRKAVANGALFVDAGAFAPRRAFGARGNTVGYFGALVAHKGVLELARAIPLVLERKQDIRFVIGGEGPARAGMEKYLSQGGCRGKVMFAGPVSHADMPGYLNESKLVVLPSYGEGLPNVVLEAMACGANVLATAVGGVPDLVRDGETGFILEDNSPECIARNIIRALECPSGAEIAGRARALVENEFTVEKAEERFRHVLDMLR